MAHFIDRTGKFYTAPCGAVYEVKSSWPFETMAGQVTWHSVAMHNPAIGHGWGGIMSEKELQAETGGVS